jgi:hypothetical protein
LYLRSKPCFDEGCGIVAAEALCLRLKLEATSDGHCLVSLTWSDQDEEKMNHQE